MYEGLLREVYALRALCLVDEPAHFDWPFSDIALEEIAAGRTSIKRQSHMSLLDKLIEHPSALARIDPGVLARTGPVDET